MPHTPPVKQKQPKKQSPTKPATHAPASPGPINLVSFSFDHRPTSFKSKSHNLEINK